METNNLYGKLLERVMADRPELAPYAELFQQLGENNTSESEDIIKQLELKLQKLSSVSKRLQKELNRSLDELDNLARALGACEQCWGEDSNCPTCRGQGKPGFYSTDRTLFDRLILPALREMPWIVIKEN